MATRMTTPYDDQNIFARIIRGEIPAQRIYEDEATLAIMDAMPQCDGHALVLPKVPSRNILDMDPAALGPTMATVQRIAQAAMKAFEADGVSVMQFSEPASGQTVFHTHFHIIPRKADVPLGRHARDAAPPEVLARNAAAYRRALGLE
jgi:histidine triad (HIT) family protein